MKILHVTKKYPDALGGDAVVVKNLQKHQEAAGHQVAILTSNCPNIQTSTHIYAFGLSDSAQALDHITPRRLVSLIGLFFKAFWVLFRERPDVIHSHSIDMAFMVSFAARFFWIPMVHTFHIVTFYDKHQSIVRRKSEILLAKASGLRMITAPNAHDVAALYDAGLHQSAVLPNGVDLAFWHPKHKDHRPPGAAYTAKQPFTFVSVGRLENQKGYDVLIRAVAQLAQNPRHPFRMVIIGEGTQKERLQRMIEKYHLQKVISLVGRRSPHQVRKVIAEADASIFSSLYETTPITLLESWAMEMPVIATSVGILRGMDPGVGFVYLVQPKDAYSLMQAMQDCMSDADTRAFVAEAGHQEVKKYAWSDIAETAETFYGSVI